MVILLSFYLFSAPTSYYTSNIAGGVSRFFLIYLKKTLAL